MARAGASAGDTNLYIGLVLALLGLAGIGGAGVVVMLRRGGGGSGAPSAAPDPIEDELQRILAEESRAAAEAAPERVGAAD